VTLSKLNAMDRAAFVAELGGIFEHSPWVAESALSAAPFANLYALHAAMVAAVAAAPIELQSSLIRAHPDLGARAKMTAASNAEQSGAGLDRLSPEEYARLQSLNTAYREKFGFPFIYAVKGATKHQIMDALTDRLAQPPHAEHAQALAQIYRIAQYRLEELFHAPLR
jgi:2-oxo-4-hydroxy-4-carboxy-5-ureidoimidazoline decarboxylase